MPLPHSGTVCLRAHAAMAAVISPSYCTVMEESHAPKRPMSPRSKSPVDRWKQSRNSGAWGDTTTTVSGAWAAMRRATSRYASRVSWMARSWPRPTSGMARGGCGTAYAATIPMRAPSRKLRPGARTFERVRPSMVRLYTLRTAAPVLYRRMRPFDTQALTDARIAALTDRLERRRSHPWSWSGSGAPCRRCRNASRKTPRWACRAPCPPIARTSSRWTARS
mgnify:FL=1